MKIIHVAETIQGGIASYLKNLLPGQAIRYGSDNIRVLAPSSQRSQLPDINIPVYLFMTGKWRLANALRVVLALRRQLQSQTADVVHVHSSFAGLTCRAYVKLFHRGIRVIYCPHGWGFARGRRADRVVAMIERVLAHFSDAVICVSQYEAVIAREKGITTSKLRVILNGLTDTQIGSTNLGDKMDLWSTDALRLVFIGRMDWAKGLDVLVAALAYVKRRLSVHVFGDSVLNDGGVLGEIPDCVHQHGWATFDVIWPYIANCHAVVVPSRAEALGYSALEAMRASKAVMGSRVGGIPEVVEDGVTGILIPPGDPLALARAIESADIELLETMGYAARKKFLCHFTATRMEAELASVYAESPKH